PAVVQTLWERFRCAGQLLKGQHGLHQLLALLKSKNATTDKPLHFVLRTDNVIRVDYGHGKSEHGSGQLYRFGGEKRRPGREPAEAVVRFTSRREWSTQPFALGGAESSDGPLILLVDREGRMSALGRSERRARGIATLYRDCVRTSTSPESQ
ncbi:hypothetical protein ACFVHT_23610, partial [Bacillus subtilis]